jgi:hypothetical protein
MSKRSGMIGSSTSRCKIREKFGESGLDALSKSSDAKPAALLAEVPLDESQL